MTAQAILHPVRMRIVLAISAGNRRLSIAQLVDVLGDVPQASVYRHVRTLEEAGVLSVVEHRSTGRAKEAVYGIEELDRLSDPANFAGAKNDELSALFQTFVAGLAAEFDRAIRVPGFDLTADRAMFVQVPLYLNAGEVEEIRRFVRSTMALRERGPGRGRRLRMFAAIGFPLAETAGSPAVPRPRARAGTKNPAG